MQCQYQEESARNTLLQLCRDIPRQTIAKTVGVTIGCVNRWVTGRRKISAEYALRIAQMSGNLAYFKPLCPEATEINNIVEQYETLTGSKHIEIAMIKQASNILQLPVSLYAVPEITKSNMPPIIVDKHYHLLAFPERLQALKNAEHHAVPAFVVDIERHLNGKVPIIPIIEHCSLSRKGIAALALQHFYAKAPGRASKDKTIMANLREFKIYNMAEIVHCVGLSSHRTFQTLINILKYGCEQLIKLMDKKELALSTIYKMAKLPHNTQRELLTLDKQDLTKALNEIQQDSKVPQTKDTAKPTLVVSPKTSYAHINKVRKIFSTFGVPFSCKKYGAEYVFTFPKSG